MLSGASIRDYTVPSEQTFIVHAGSHLKNVLADLERGLWGDSAAGLFPPPGRELRAPVAPKMDLMSQSFKVRDRTDYVIHLKFHFPFFRKQNICLFDSVILGGPSKYLLKEEVNNSENVAYVLRNNISQLLCLK